MGLYSCNVDAERKLQLKKICCFSGKSMVYTHGQKTKVNIVNKT